MYNLPGISLRSLLIAACILSQFSVFAQTDATVSRDSARIVAYNLESTAHSGDKGTTLTTNLDGMQLYQTWYRTQYFNTSLGNLGNPFQSLVYAQQFNRGFHFGFRAFEPYTFQLEDQLVYDAQAPYTEAFYVQGGKVENFFRLLHTQNIGKKFNAGFEFKRVNSEGQYVRQAAAHSALRIHALFKPGKGRYQVLAAAVYHKGVSQENGGLTAEGDSLYGTELRSNPKLLPINLGIARNEVFQNGLLVRQHVDLFRWFNDSLPAKKGGFLRVQHTFLHGFQKHAYDDEQPVNAYYDTVFESGRLSTTYNMLRFISESALMRISSGGDTSKFLRFDARAFVRQQWAVINAAQFIANEQVLFDVFNQSAGVALHLANRTTTLDARGEYFYAGFNAGDQNLDIRYKQELGKEFTIGIRANQFKQTPDGQLLHFVSNFGRWKNDFDPIKHQNFSAELNAKKLRLSLIASWQNTNGFIYLDSLAKPVQDSGAVNVIRLGLTHTLRLWKFYLQSNICYQKSSNSETIRIPEIQFRESFYFQSRIRKAAPIMRIGVDLTGCTAFRSQAYLPFAGMYFNTSNQATSNLFLLDFYVSVQVRRARFFLKSEHTNSLWSESDYVVSPFYPLARHGIKLGLSWVFFD